MLDPEKIIAAIIASGVPPLAAEAGSNLVDAWLAKFAAEDAKDRILAVECGFSIRLDEITWAIGVMDLIAQDEAGIFGSEWKSTKEPGRYWNEDKWLESISTGPQIALYALALAKGDFYQYHPETTNLEVISVSRAVSLPVRIRVRAAVKTAIPSFWPREPRDGWRTFDERALHVVADGFKSKAAQIRAARKAGIIPWQLVGRQCFEFNAACQWYDECRGFNFPADQVNFDSDDPAAKLALPFLPVEARSPEAVILSASAYQNYGKCMELGRRNSMADGEKESNLALNTGTALHAGLASLYTQLRADVTQ